MANYTPNLNLRKPLTTEKYDVVADLNDTKDKIDTHAGAVDAQLAQNSNQVAAKFNANGIRRIAHRGAESVAPQNTTQSTEYAGMQGYYGVECDLQVTSDGEWVLFHDDTLDVLTNGTGTVLSKTLAEIKALVIDNGPFTTSRWVGCKIPTLREFLEICNKWNLIPFLELKHFELVNLPSLYAVLEEYNMEHKAVFMSTIAVTSYLKELYPTCNTCTLIGANSIEITEVANLIPYSIVALPHTTLTKELTNEITAQGLQCAVWTNGGTFADFDEDYKKWGVSYTIGGIL